MWTRTLAVAAAGAIALAACAPGTTVTTVTETVAASPSTSPGATPDAALFDQPIGTWVITFTGIGPFTVEQTHEDLTALTGEDYSSYLDYFEGFCASWNLGFDNRLAGFVALAESDGARGPVDTYLLFEDEGVAEPLPSTAEGITIGSTFADIDKAYGDGLIVEQHFYDETWTNAYRLDNGYGMLFTLNETDVIVSITVGRDPQFRYIEGCA